MPVRNLFLAVFFSLGAISSGQQPTNPALSPKPLARDVMYRVLFREIAAYQTQADRLVAQSKPDGFVRNFHQQLLQLTPAQFSQVKEIVLPCVQQMQAVDVQARMLIDAVKSQHRGAAKGSPNAMVPPPPPELADLEAKRTALILAAADAIAAALGPSQFAYFENLARRHVGSSFQVSTAGKTQ